MNKFGGMKRTDAGEVLNLMAAGDAARDEHRPSLHVSSSRQQTSFPDGSRHVVMISNVPERSGHATTTGVQVDNGCARNAGKQRLCRRDEPHRLLMAVAVELNRRRPCFQRRR